MNPRAPRRARLVVAATLPTLVVAALALTALSPAPSTPASAADSPAAGGRFFERTATYPVFLNRPAGEDPATTTVAEISAATPDGTTLVYTDGPASRVGFLDITDPGAPVGAGTYSLARTGDAKAEPTAVAITGDYLIVVVDTSRSFTDTSGRADVIRISDRSLAASIPLGGQPDSIALSKDGAYAAVAIENERHESVNGADLPQLPAGFLQVLTLRGQPSSWAAAPVSFTNSDGTALASFTAAGIDTPQDPEPEYVSINEAGKVAVSLQENNAIVVVDVATGAIERVFSAGSASVEGVDTTRNGLFDPTSSITQVREPDAVAWVGPDLLATANEGDWKGGSRGWTVFRASTGAVVWDAGSSFEQLAVRHGLFNDARAASKGVEPEGLAFSVVGGTPYAFVGSERANFVAVYDMTDPTRPAFTQILPTTNGPEGILPIPGTDLLAVSSETDNAAVSVRASVSLFELGASTAFFPSIVAADLPGATPAQPIGWGALGALSASPTDPTTVYAASDAAYRTGRIYTVDVAATPARITGVTQVQEGGTTPPIDIEGLAARPAGGFWLAAEGATGPANQLVRVDAAGVVQERVDLPTEVSSKVRNWGLEGVTLAKGTTNETLYVALQRPLWTTTTGPLVPAEGNVTRIGRYDTVTRSWTWFAYPLATTSTDQDWIGVSEVVALDTDTLAVIERDKLNGPAAAIKRIHTVDVPAATGALTPLTKRLARNLLPDLRATNGWTQEKVEGLTVAADGRAYAVTDNDGLANATGETLFLRLGDLFGLVAAPGGPPAPPPPAPSPTPGATATRTILTAPGRVRAGGRIQVRVRVVGARNGTVRVVTSSGVRRTLALTDGRARTTLRPRKAGVLVIGARFTPTPTAAASVSRFRTVVVGPRR